MPETADAIATTWWLYLIECRDGSYYAGITTDVQARYAIHVAGKGARYTRSHPPQRLIGARAYAGRSQASRAEWEIKQLPKARKIAYLQLPAPTTPGNFEAG
ncbi:GIY-YIG nuclease family protein [Dyella sp. C9]|uniref:GIY-YIG nuclease family protein n=1 Tax=Dyella sp. C9 TaxID=2202154 RepID=UPI000DEF29CA|nr:GIY-YIG nuclease family protein [Dyella sp. C9]